jgi:uncharacterized protein YndB with AHSA1/START domain
MNVPLQVKHQFRASSERVYDAFLDPEKAGKFLFCTPDGQMVRVEIDPRVGGAFVFVDRRDGVDVEHVGKYVELDRPSRLVFIFTVPRYSPLETRVSIAIVPLGAGCEVTLTHDLPPDQAKQAEAGWTKILERLDSLLG